MAGGPLPQQFPAHRFLTFFGPLNPPFSNNLRVYLSNFIHQNAQKVTLLFASNGGATDDGMALFTYLKALPYELTIHAVGPVSSMAVPVFLSVDSAHRIASRNARFFFHDYTWNLVQQNGPVTREMLKGPAMFLEDAAAWTKEVLRANTHLTDADFESMKLFEHPILMDATRAVQVGIASSVAEPAIPVGCQPLVVV
jgi:ATP-dependent protease ClpP protease subunit